jgi:hypothetical protein
VPTIDLHQALHGYANGHRLLASSLPLHGESRRAIDSLSDASGTNLSSANVFFPYLTGYPLPDGKHYVLAKTWLAAQAARPGTVWTHSLLIPFSNLAKIPSLVPLVGVFHEPRGLTEFSDYEISLKVTTSPRSQTPALQQDLVMTILDLLYNQPNSVVILPSHDPHTFQTTVLELWSQQWPRLRRKFSFCTGALELRQLGGKPLDLQIVREDKTVSHPLAQQVQAPFRYSGASWIQTLYQDLLGRGDDLRSFLNRFGAELTGNRADMPILVTVFELVKAVRERRHSPDELVRYVMSTLNAGEGGNLKQAVLTSQGFGGLLQKECEYSLLNIASMWPEIDALDGDKLRLIERSQAFARGDAVRASRLLRQLLRHGNRHGSSIAKTLIESLSEHQLESALQHNRPLLLKAVGIYAELAHRKMLWRQPKRVQEQVFGQLASVEDPSWWRLVITAMLSAKSDVLVDQVAKRFDGALLGTVLDWYADGHPLPHAWKQRASKASLIARWLEEQSDLDLFRTQRVLELSEPDKKAFHNISVKPWLELAQNVRQRPEFTSLATFLLCLGFWNVGGQVEALFGLCFGPVYEALKKGQLDPVPERWLRPKLSPKPLFWFGTYTDRSALGRAIVHSLIYHKAQPQRFLAYLTDQELLQLDEAVESDLRAQRWLSKELM